MTRRTRGLALAAVSAALALVGVSSLAGYVREVDGRVGDLVPVLRLRHDVAAHHPLVAADVEQIRLPRRWAPAHAVATLDQASGLVLAVALRSGAHLTTDVLAPRPELAPGQRELAILIDAETGVAGKVAAGARVDIVATFPEEGDAEPRSEVIVAAAEVLEVGDLGADDLDDEGFSTGRVVPVTFALSVRESLVLTYAESFATRVRLALVAPLEEGPVPVGDRTFTLPATDRSTAGATGGAG